jgi:uncharacterized membrane protein
MSTPLERAREEFTGILVFLILGAGFVALFAGYSWFWMVWVLGFAVLLPIVGILTGETEEDDEELPIGARRTGTETSHSGTHDERVEDALETLRARYARGDLSDEQFERKLEALLETESPEEARDRVRRTRAGPNSDDDAESDVGVDSDVSGQNGRDGQRDREADFEFDRERT